MYTVYDFENDVSEDHKLSWEDIKQVFREKMNKYASLHPKRIYKLICSLCRILRSWSKTKRMLIKIGMALRNLSIVSFYQYLWQRDKVQFVMNLFIAYGLPLLLEMVPWYLSRRKVGRKLRLLRNKISNGVIRRNGFQREQGMSYLWYTVVYVGLTTLEQHVKNRVNLMDKYLIKRLVLERLLYTEVTSENNQGKELELRIMFDIHRTLRLFTYTVPQVFSNIYAIVDDSRDLYHNRQQVDALAILRPVLSSFTWWIVDWIKVLVFGQRISKLYVTNPLVSQLFQNSIDGIVDIQLNNLQSDQLKMYDSMLYDEFSWTESIKYFINRGYRTFTNRGAIDFISHIAVTDLVMQRRNLNYEQYRKVQSDIDHLRNLFRRTYKHIDSIQKVLTSQTHVVSLMNQPNFQDEDSILPYSVHHLEYIVLRNIVFSYHPKGHPPYALNFRGEVKFESGKSYGIIGTNRSGKSTLAKIICKLLKPQMGDIFMNDVDFFKIRRNSLRELISYVSQTPFIFPGTIRDNLLIGNPKASDEEILQAAQYAGIFTFDEMLQEQQERMRNKLAKRIVKPKPEKPYIECKITPEYPIKVNLFPDDNYIHVDLIKNHSWQPKRSINVSFCQKTPTIKKPPKKAITQERKMEILALRIHARGKNISGGFRQSIALARVFLNPKCRLMILDECMSAMDPIKKRCVIYPSLIQYTRKHGITLIMISHDMICVDYVEHVILLESGQIVCQGHHRNLQHRKKYRQMLGRTKLSSL